MGVRRRRPLPAAITAHHVDGHDSRSRRRAPPVGQQQHRGKLQRRDDADDLFVRVGDLRARLPPVLSRDARARARRGGTRRCLRQHAGTGPGAALLQPAELVSRPRAAPGFCHEPPLHGADDGGSRGPPRFAGPRDRGPRRGRPAGRRRLLRANAGGPDRAPLHARPAGGQVYRAARRRAGPARATVVRAPARRAGGALPRAARAAAAVVGRAAGQRLLRDDFLRPAANPVCPLVRRHRRDPAERSRQRARRPGERRTSRALEADGGAGLARPGSGGAVDLRVGLGGRRGGLRTPGVSRRVPRLPGSLRRTFRQRAEARDGDLARRAFAPVADGGDAGAPGNGRRRRLHHARMDRRGPSRSRAIAFARTHARPSAAPGDLHVGTETRARASEGPGESPARADALVRPCTAHFPRDRPSSSRARGAGDAARHLLSRSRRSPRVSRWPIHHGRTWRADRPPAARVPWLPTVATAGRPVRNPWGPSITATRSGGPARCRPARARPARAWAVVRE